MFFDPARIGAFREMICSDTVEEREAALNDFPVFVLLLHVDSRLNYSLGLHNGNFGIRFTQMTFGFSRDDAGKFLPSYYANKIYESDPFSCASSAR